MLVKRHPRGHDHHLKQLTPTDEFLILELVAEKPGVYLKELQAEIFENTVHRYQLVLSAPSYIRMDLLIENYHEFQGRDVIF